MTIDSFSKCDCGAVTLYFTNGQNNSILKSNLKKFGIVIPLRVRRNNGKMRRST